MQVMSKNSRRTNYLSYGATTTKPESLVWELILGL